MFWNIYLDFTKVTFKVSECNFQMIRKLQSVKINVYNVDGKIFLNLLFVIYKNLLPSNGGTIRIYCFIVYCVFFVTFN